jgi:hypothetical protein
MSESQQTHEKYSTLLSNITEDSIFKAEYKHKTLKMFPEKLYKEKEMYQLNLEAIYKLLPEETLYFKKPPDKYFSFLFTNSKLNKL